MISSTAFSDGKVIPVEYSCQGKNSNPPLEFSNVPPESKSLVLIMDDPDVPRSILPDGLFVHWLVWNIPPTTSSIAADSIPPGVSGNNGRATLGYTGPCPPNGEHRYYFRLYALDTELVLSSGSTKADLLGAMEGHILDRAELMGRFSKT